MSTIINEGYALKGQQLAALKAFLATLENDQQLVSVAMVIEDQLQRWSTGTVAACELVEAGVPADQAVFVARSYAGHVGCYTEHLVADCVTRYKAGEFDQPYAEAW